MAGRFERQVESSQKDASEKRKQRLAVASAKPQKTQVIATAFKRNPDVVAEVLSRANGICELCNNPAPFVRKNDGEPYLEVHHKIQLADGGEDTVENAVAACPNCHRKAHYGV
jgi:5-methylcytosine-specific restriction protein A